MTRPSYCGLRNSRLQIQSGLIVLLLFSLQLSQAATLLNVNFAATGRVKMGFAATGQASNDFWNAYTAPSASIAAVSNLALADGATTAVGLTVANGGGHTGFSYPDLMYQCACYAQDFGDITLTVTNLPSGSYDLYLYGHSAANDADTLFQVLVGGSDLGNQATATNSDWSLTNWVEGAQYVVYRKVSITNGGAPLTVKCHPGLSGYTYLNGIQISAASAVTLSAPVISSQPTNQSAFIGGGASFTLGATGSAPLAYQWRHSGTNLPGATDTLLQLGNLQTSDAGGYDIVVSNSVGFATSSNAVLTVLSNPPVTLLNVNFAATGRVKMGFAATGQASNDFWNAYTAPSASIAAVSNLALADGATTAVGLTVANGGGHTGFSYPDLMYQCACYAQDFGDITLTVTNLPSGSYDLYLYGHSAANDADTLFQVLVGGSDLGNQATATNSDWSLTNWVEGAQYVVYRKVSITNGGAPLTVKCHPGLSGYTYLNGIQIAASGSSNSSPVAVNMNSATRQNVSITIPGDKFLLLSSDPDNDPLALVGVSATSTNGGSVLLVSNQVIYVPASNYIGADRFTYTIADGRGGTGAAFVLLSVCAANQVSGNMLPVSTLPTGLQVSFVGVPGLFYSLQRATNVNGPWITLTSVEATSNGVGSFTDTNPPPASAFYRTGYP